MNRFWLAPAVLSGQRHFPLLQFSLVFLSLPAVRRVCPSLPADRRVCPSLPADPDQKVFHSRRARLFRTSHIIQAFLNPRVDLKAFRSLQVDPKASLSRQAALMV